MSVMGCDKLADHSKLMSDAIELLTCGECYLRVWEMGKLDGPEEVEVVLKRRNHPGISELEKEKDERKSPEVVLEMLPEVVPEVVPDVDVQLTLQ